MSTRADPHDKRARRRLQRDEKRSEILDTTVKLLLRQDEPSARMDEIAKEAGLSTASLYKYFPDGKDELYEALIERVLSADGELLDEAFDSDKPPHERLKAVGAAYVEFGVKYPGLFRFVSQPTSFGPLAADQVELVGEHLSHLLDRVADLIARGQGDDAPEAHRIAAHCDPLATARVLHAAWYGIIGLSLRDAALNVDNRLDVQELSSIAMDIVEHGIASRRDDEARAVALRMLVASKMSVDDVDAQLRETFSVTLDELMEEAEPG